jgi:hypothetical protein
MRAAWAVVALVLLGAAAPAPAGTVRGRVTLVDKGGRAADDAGDAVVWVDGPKVRPRPSSATVVM